MARGARKSPEQVTLERTRIGERYATARTAIRWTAGIVALYVSKDLLVALAGRETILALKLAFLGDWKTVLSYIFAGGGVGYGYTERRLRQSAIKRLHNRVKELETMIDPNRTSSGLTVEGKTNPQDRRP